MNILLGEMKKCGRFIILMINLKKEVKKKKKIKLEMKVIKMVKVRAEDLMFHSILVPLLH